ncbi:MAG: VOC family protein [Proteobacteria bacterium]|nr:VOC family protein [Pseudomonadota bacterium]
MFSHVTVGSNDIARARRFYDSVTSALGLKRHADYPEAVAYGVPDGRPQLWIVRPLDKKAASAGNGITIGLDATDRSAVDRAHAAAMASGGTDEGKPGLRTHYHPNYYGAYVRDPDGNKVCIVCHKPV